MTVERRPRTKAELAAFALATLCAVGFLIVIAMVIGGKVRLDGMLWHLQHGTTLRILNADVPVPLRYGVLTFKEEAGDESYMLLDRISKSPFARMSVGRAPGGPVSKDQLDRDIARIKGQLEAKGRMNVQRKDVAVEGGLVECVSDGKRPSTESHYFEDNELWICRSTFGVSFILSGTPADLEEQWRILAGTRLR